MSYGARYTAPPPAYDEEAQEPLLNNAQDDVFKETVANSSIEIRMRKSAGYSLVKPLLTDQ